MRLSCFLTFGLVLVLLTACNAFLPAQNNPNTLSLKLEIVQRDVKPLDDLYIQVYLANQSNSSVLVHERLHSLPFPIPPLMTEVLILISDSSGNLVDNTLFHSNYSFPSEDTLTVLKPGEEIERTYHLVSVGFWERLFKKGEKYTIVVVYQNDIDMNKMIDGVEVPAWVGSIRSNEETFVILP